MRFVEELIPKGGGLEELNAERPELRARECLTRVQVRERRESAEAFASELPTKASGTELFTSIRLRVERRKRPGSSPSA